MKLCGVCKSPLINSRFNSRPILAYVLAALLLSSCASITAVLPSAVAPVAPADSAALHIKIVAVLTAVPGDGEPTRRVRLTWERIFIDDEVRDIVEIKNLLGNTQARLENSAAGMEIFIAGKPAAATPEVRRLLDILPPPQAMGYWLLGASDPDYSTREIFIPGEVGVGKIIQHGWEVTYQKRTADGRPQRIHLRPTAQGTTTSPPPPPDAEATLEIIRWLPTS